MMKRDDAAHDTDFSLSFSGHPLPSSSVSRVAGLVSLHERPTDVHVSSGFNSAYTDIRPKPLMISLSAIISIRRGSGGGGGGGACPRHSQTLVQSISFRLGMFGVCTPSLPIFHVRDFSQQKPNEASVSHVEHSSPPRRARGVCETLLVGSNGLAQNSL